MPGVLYWLRCLKQRDIPQAVASGAPPENIEFLVDEMGIRVISTPCLIGWDARQARPDGLPGGSPRLGRSTELCGGGRWLAWLAGSPARWYVLHWVTTTTRQRAALADRVVESLEDLPMTGLTLFPILFGPQED